MAEFSAVVAVVALLLSLVAVALATVANRRWVRRPRAKDPDPAPELHRALEALSEQARAARDRADEVAELLAPLQGGLQAVTGEVTVLREDLGRQDERLAETSDDAADAAAQVAAVHGRVDDVVDLAAGLSHRIDGVAGQAGEVSGRVDDLVGRLDAADEQLAGTVNHLAGLADEVTRIREEGPAPDPTALRNVAVVRYDAFADVGGRLSYSVALLDDTESGVVLTTLAGKSDVRTYVRTISAGRGDVPLSDEEQQAVAAARGQS